MKFIKTLQFYLIYKSATTENTRVAMVNTDLHIHL